MSDTKSVDRRELLRMAFTGTLLAAGLGVAGNAEAEIVDFDGQKLESGETPTYVLKFHKVQGQEYKLMATYGTTQDLARFLKEAQGKALSVNKAGGEGGSGGGGGRDITFGAMKN